MFNNMRVGENFFFVKKEQILNFFAVFVLQCKQEYVNIPLRHNRILPIKEVFAIL